MTVCKFVQITSFCACTKLDAALLALIHYCNNKIIQKTIIIITCCMTLKYKMIASKLMKQLSTVCRANRKLFS